MKQLNPEVALQVGWLVKPRGREPANSGWSCRRPLLSGFD